LPLVPRAGEAAPGASLQIACGARVATRGHASSLRRFGHRIKPDESLERTPGMNTLKLKTLFAVLLVAASLGAIPVHAQGLRVGSRSDYSYVDLRAGRPHEDHGSADATDVDSQTVAWTLLGRIGANHFNDELSLLDLGCGQSPLPVGLQFVLTDRVVVGGEWEEFPTFSIDGRPNPEPYAFGIWVSF
jgi:hypothetical protein